MNNYCDVTNKMHDWIFDECHRMVKVNIFQSDWQAQLVPFHFGKASYATSMKDIPLESVEEHT